MGVRENQTYRYEYDKLKEFVRELDRFKIPDHHMAEMLVDLASELTNDEYVVHLVRRVVGNSGLTELKAIRMYGGLQAEEAGGEYDWSDD